MCPGGIPWTIVFWELLRKLVRRGQQSTTVDAQEQSHGKILLKTRAPNLTSSNSNNKNKMSNLEIAMNELANQTNDIFIIFFFTAGILVILIIFWLLYKINEEQFLSQRQLQNVENYIQNGVNYGQNQVEPSGQFGQRNVIYPVERLPDIISFSHLWSS